KRFAPRLAEPNQRRPTSTASWVRTEIVIRWSWFRGTTLKPTALGPGWCCRARPNGRRLHEAPTAESIRGDRLGPYKGELPGRIVSRGQNHDGQWEDVRRAHGAIWWT